MTSIQQLIEFQIEKMAFIQSYLAANELVTERAIERNFNAIRELMEKKQGLATAIDVVDSKIIQGIEKLKEEARVDDLASLSPLDYPELKQLKIEAGKVLKAMVSIKASDEAVTTHIDAAFVALKTSVKHMDRNKIYYYTKSYFEPE